MMFNSEDVNATRTAVWSEIPELKGKKKDKRGDDGYKVTDAWTGKDLGCVKKEYSVQLESHDVAVLIVKEVC